MNCFMWVVIFSALITYSFCQTSCPRVCRCDVRKTVYCMKKHLQQIPYGIPDTTLDLRLQENSIGNGRTTSENLSALKRLKKLHLHQNKLTSVPSGLASTLDYIDFKSNNIKYVGKLSLKGLSMLTELYLGKNNITNQGLLKQTFKDTRVLQVLDLSENLLTKLPENLPKSLRVLLLSKNQIDFISLRATRKLTNLTNLDLSQNKIVQTTIQHRAFFELSTLISLDLSRNQLSEVPIGLPSSLKTLLLRGNKLEYVFSEENSQHGSLNSIKTLKRVDLSSNRLKSVENDAFSDLDLHTIELHDNPWQCDCYLRYLKKWLNSKKATLSSESYIQCSSPAAFAGVSLSSIDEEALQCITKTDSTDTIKVLETTSSEVLIQWRSQFRTPDPAFITRSLKYGPMKCKNCTLPDLLSDYSPSQRMTTFLESYSSQEFASDHSSVGVYSMNLTVNKLEPNCRYLFCVFDSQQSELIVTTNNCLDIDTPPGPTPLIRENEVSIPLWAIIFCLVFILFFVFSIIGIVFIKRKKNYRSKTPNPYSLDRDTRYYPDIYLPNLNPSESYRYPLVGGGYETNLSDRTYAECGPPNSNSTGQRTFRDSEIDARMEFEVLIKQNNRKPQLNKVRRATSSTGSDFQESTSVSTNRTDMSFQQSSALSSPTYDLLHSYNPVCQQSRVRTRSLPARPATDSGIYI